ncbi:hypothetical protein HD806DRAFT_545685 [Xylariaceae sp. AK1471]|nr:hypothetical protein HD806DRAFT_545685 [Xylariaceae sp. AK1471]
MMGRYAYTDDQQHTRTWNEVGWNSTSYSSQGTWLSRLTTVSWLCSINDSPSVLPDTFDRLLGRDEDERITKRIKWRGDIYEFASDSELAWGFRVPAWWGQEEQNALTHFMGNRHRGAPHVGIIRVQAQTEAVQEAFRVAVQQITAHHDSLLRTKEQHHVLFVEPGNIELANVKLGHQQIWSSLVKDLAAKLCPLTKDSTKISDTDNADDDADRCLKAIEEVKELTSPCEPIKHFCFIAGLDRAYNRNTNIKDTWGHHLEQERKRLAAFHIDRLEGTSRAEPPPTDMHEQAQHGIDPDKLVGKLEQVQDDNQRKKFERLVRALERLFTKNNGRVVFFIESDFPDLEDLVEDKNNIKTVIKAPPLRDLTPPPWQGAVTRLDPYPI